MTGKSIMQTFSGARILRQTPVILRSLLENATEENLDWQPAPDRWSITMVLAHLADVERKGMMQRLHAIAEEEHPHLRVYDQLELFRSGRKFEGIAQLAAFEGERKDVLAWLDTVPAATGARTGHHEELGVISFDQLLHEFAFHDLGHIRQILELYRSRAFYPNMGAFQSYYTIRP